MKPLPQSFKEGGFTFQLLRREGKVALLSKSKPGFIPRYEVVIIQIRPEETIYGRHYPAREVMPHTEQWGTYGWTPFDKEAAELRFNQLAELAIAA